MSDHPIIPPMVWALLQGRKTQTWRLVKGNILTRINRSNVLVVERTPHANGQRPAGEAAAQAPRRGAAIPASRRGGCHDNLVERKVRPAVIARKLSVGSRAEAGAETQAVLASALRTY